MIQKISKDIISILITVILGVLSIGNLLFSDIFLNYKHYVGFGLVGVSFFLYFKSKKLYVYFYLLTLVLGIVNLIDVYYWNMTFGIRPIKFNAIFVTLLIIFLAFNKELLDKMFPEKMQTEKELTKINVEKQSMIKNYEQKFQSKTESELKKIADENSGYVNEAKIASKNLLLNKNVL